MANVLVDLMILSTDFPERAIGHWSKGFGH